MANFYYVKEGGAATGDAGRVETTKSTGSFDTKGSSNYYDAIDDAVGADAPPTAGDLIFVSDASVNTESTTYTMTIPDGVQVVSVSDTNCDQYSAGATIDNTSAGSDDWIRINPAANGWASYRGFTFDTNEWVSIVATDSYRVRFEDCTFEKHHASGSVFASSSSSGSQRSGMCELINCTVIAEHSSNSLTFPTDGYIDNLQAGAGHAAIDTVFILQASLGGNDVRVTNTDLSALGATATCVSFANADHGNIILDRCKIGASQTLHSTILVPTNTITVSSCDAGDGYYYSYYADFYGAAEQDTTTYLNATYDGTNGFSIQVDTTAEASISTPFRYKLGSIPAQDLSSSKTVTVEATSATGSLDNGDWWLELVRQDNTDQALGVAETTQHATATESGDGTAHTTSGTGTWTSGAATDYIETITPGALANVDNDTVEVWVVVAKPSLTINFDLPTIAAT